MLTFLPCYAYSSQWGLIIVSDYSLCMSCWSILHIEELVSTLGFVWYSSIDPNPRVLRWIGV
jgi:hypothetical protein